MGCNQSTSNKVETSNEDDITPKIYQSTNYNSTESSISEKKSGKTYKYCHHRDGYTQIAGGDKKY